MRLQYIRKIADSSAVFLVVRKLLKLQGRGFSIEFKVDKTNYSYVKLKLRLYNASSVSQYMMF